MQLQINLSLNAFFEKIEPNEYVLTMTSLNPNVDWCLVDGPNMEGLSPTNHPHHDIFLGPQPASSPPILIDEMRFIMSPPYLDLQVQETPATLQFGEVTSLGAARDTHLCLPAVPPLGSFGQWSLFNDETSLTPRMTNSAGSEAQNIRTAELITPIIGQRKRLSRKGEPRQGTLPLPETDRSNGARVSESISRYMANRRKHLDSNRQAAKRCREKRKSRDAALESEFNELSTQNSQLLAISEGLRSELFILQNELLKHSLCRDEPIERHLAQGMQKMSARDGFAT
ncbi:transcriptional regulator family: bZIP [Penicillium roqueforti]|nr:transcriptional regulator family: bZIP [Penicillium roqueforti]KAI3185022.1 transcriptional regulator family: bZIP [Penicillium roqueforti]